MAYAPGKPRQARADRPAPSGQAHDDHRSPSPHDHPPDPWAALADPSLELRNYGVYGERTDEIARRLEAAAAGADVLVVQGGINDVAQGRLVEEAFWNQALVAFKAAAEQRTEEVE